MKVRRCVLLCDTASHTGGVSTVMLAQAQGLVGAGVQVSVFAACGPVDAALARACSHVHCVHAAPVARRHWAEVWNLQVSHSLADFLRAFSPHDTLVHVHSVSMGLSASVGHALRASRIPYLITAHDAGWACPTGYLYHFRAARPCLLAPMSLACLASHCDKRTPLHKAYKVIKIAVLDQWSHLKQDAAFILAPSDMLRQCLVPRVPQGTKVITLLNPVDIAWQAPRPSAGRHFLFVGRLWEEKGITELLSAIGDRYPLVVVGDGPLRTRLASQYPKVIFKGWLSAQEVGVEMQQALALVLPSLSLEAFGLVVAEALARGVPAIVSHRAGAASLIAPGKNGFVIDMQAPMELERRCADLSDSAVAQRMGAKAHALYWANPLSTQAYMESLFEIFDAI